MATPSQLPLQFIRADGSCFEVSITAWSVLQQFAQHNICATEAGGVLLGRHLRDRSAIIVDVITIPQPGDHRSRSRFHRSRKHHQAIINKVWSESGGTCTYLGEWHTHPEEIPTPSLVDWNDWRRHLREDHYTEPIFFIIVGTMEIRAWEGCRQGLIAPLLARLEK